MRNPRFRSTVAFGLTLGAFLAQHPVVSAPWPEITRDLNSEPLPINSGARNLVETDTLVFFVASNEQTGTELWRTDGTSDGTRILKDINPGFQSSSVSRLTRMGQDLFFIADDGTNGPALWRSDGSDEGTTKVFSPSHTFGPLVAVGNTLFFGLSNGDNGWRLWKTDGTPEGTVLVKDPGEGYPNPIYVGDLVIAGSSLLYFTVRDGGDRALWRSDGTTEGTYDLGILAPPFGSDDETKLAVLDDILYLASDNGVDGEELWRSDGTVAGTYLLKDINPGALGSTLYELTPLGDHIYFRANDGTHGTELWRSDGTEAGTELVADINPPASEGAANGSSFPQQLTTVGPTLYFVATDGTTAGNKGLKLWRTDGTPGGTVMIDALGGRFHDSEIGQLANINGTLYFHAADPASPSAGIELWKSDGTVAGTTMVKDINPGPGSATPYYPTPLGTSLCFVAHDDVHGSELWGSDGTAEGTVLLKDIAQGTGDSLIGQIAASGDFLFFSNEDALHGRELWISDGTPQGTGLLKDIAPGAPDSNPRGFASAGTTLLFIADDETSTGALWKSDGTEGGTEVLRRIPVAWSDSGPWSGPTTVGETVFFVASGDGAGYELWRSDGTEAGTAMVRDIQPGPASSSPIHLTAVDDTLYFFANDGSTGNELWKSDGTEGGTVLVKDLRPGSNSAGVLEMTAGAGEAFVSTIYQGIWKTDGTAAGTSQISTFSRASQLTFAGGNLYFAKPYISDTLYAIDLQTGVESLVYDSRSSRVTDLTAFDDRVFFSDEREVMISDGTVAGTVPLGIPVIRSGGSPSTFSVAGEILYFENRDVLWRSDGSASGSTRILSRNLEPFTDPTTITVAGNRAYFVANQFATGRELFSFELTGPPVLDAWTFGELTSNSTKLAGTVIPAGLGTTLTLELGLTPGYGTTLGIPLGSPSSLFAQEFELPLAGLQAGATYYYRLTATNAAGTVSSSEATFSLLNSPPVFAGFAFSTSLDSSRTTPLGQVLSGSSDPEGNSFSISAADAHSERGGRITIEAGNLLYVPGVGTWGGDSFDVVITDQWGASTTGTIAVTITLPEGIVPTGNPIPVQVTMNGLSHPFLAYQGAPGETYTIERSMDLLSWTAVATVVAPQSGLVTHEDTTAEEGLTFYRLAR